MSFPNPKIAIVHDWLVDSGGAEKVLAEMLDIWPEADLFAVIDFFSDRQRIGIGGKKAKTTFIQQLPFAKTRHRYYLPLMPIAIEQLDLSGYDLIISSSYAVAKGVLVGPDQLHVSYVHSPIRYAWDLQHEYLRESSMGGGLKGFAARYFLHKVRIWDSRTANGVDSFVANSNFISRRIKKVYGRDSEVIYPPVSIKDFSLFEAKDDFYLTASRLVPYKRVDLIVDAFAAMPSRKLIVIGDGPEMIKIKSKASANVQILGYQDFGILKDHMQRARAFIFAAEEDFGITPVEAQACGTPVIAYGKGGALETIRPLELDEPTGVFFGNQNVESICAAVERFESNNLAFLPKSCRKNAEQFSAENFKEKLKDFVSKKYALFVDGKVLSRS